jgi:hypothetical protein
VTSPWPLDQWSGLLVIAMLVAALPIGIGPRRPTAYVIVCGALAASSLAWSAYVFVPTPLLLVYAGCLLVSASSAAQAAHPGGRPASRATRAWVLGERK